MFNYACNLKTVRAWTRREILIGLQLLLDPSLVLIITSFYLHALVTVLWYNCKQQPTRKLGSFGCYTLCSLLCLIQCIASSVFISFSLVVLSLNKVFSVVI